MSVDHKRIKKYLENIPYGEDSLSSEIHGKHNQLTTNHVVSSLALEADRSLANGDKDSFGKFFEQIRIIANDFDEWKGIKEEGIMNLGSGKNQNKMFSNKTNTAWIERLVTEDAQVSFREVDGIDLRPVFSVIMPDGEEVTKDKATAVEDWVVKGPEEAQFMQMQQDAVKQRNTVGQPLDFDIDWAVSNLIKSEDAATCLTFDEVGGEYFINTWMAENEEDITSGKIPDEMLHPDSFNPTTDPDNRLFTYLTNRLKKSFDPNHQTPKEAQEADELMAKTNNENTQA